MNGTACGVSGECCSAWCSPISGQCATAPAGETCGTATLLNLSSGSASVTGSTLGATEDVSLSCAGITSDVLYRFTLTTAQRVTVQVTSYQFTPAVGLFSAACASELRCLAGGSTPQFTMPYLAPGTYVVAVKGVSGSGSFTLNVTSSAPLPGESCEAPRVVTPDQLGAWSDPSANWYSFKNPQLVTPQCTVGSGLPVVHKLSLASPAMVWFSYTDSSFDGRTGIYGPAPSPAQCTATLEQCAPVSSSNDAFHRQLPAGDHYFVTRGNYASLTAFDVHVASGPSAESCRNPVVLTSGTPVAGTTVGRTSDSSACSAPGRDAVYMFEVPSLAWVDVGVTATGTPWNPTLNLERVLDYCQSFSTACQTADAGVASLPHQLLTAGTYFAWVDGLTAADTGAFSINATVRTVESIPGATCANPIPLTLVNDTVTVSGTTVDMIDNGAPQCRSGYATVSDVVYSVTLTAARSLTATLDATDARLSPILAIDSQCAGPTDLACTYGYGPITVSTPTLSPGTYFIKVDGRNLTNNSDGPYTLTVTAQ
jgi:hypothetical protein